jgi:hypothetical protein
VADREGDCAGAERAAPVAVASLRLAASTSCEGLAAKSRAAVLGARECARENHLAWPRLKRDVKFALRERFGGDKTVFQTDLPQPPSRRDRLLHATVSVLRRPKACFHKGSKTGWREWEARTHRHYGATEYWETRERM